MVCFWFAVVGYYGGRMFGFESFPVAPGTLALFCLAELAFSVSPGTIVMVVVARAMYSGMRAAIATALGALLGNLLFFVVSATAVGALFAALREWFFIAQWSGAAYLFALAGMLFFGKAQSGARPHVGAGGAFWQGFALQMANPKTILFFIAFLPLFVEVDKPLAGQIAVLAAASFLVEFAVLFAYAKLAHASARMTGERFQVHIHKVAALLLVAAAASLLLLKAE